MSWWRSSVRYGKSVRHHNAGSTSWDSFLFVINRARCDIVTGISCHHWLIRNCTMQETTTQGSREAPRPVEEYWLTCFLVLVVCSK